MEPDAARPAFRGALADDGALVLADAAPALAALLDAPHPDDAALVRGARVDALAGEAIDVEYRVVDGAADGAVRWVVERLRPRPDGGVDVAGELVDATVEAADDDLRALLGALDEALYAIDLAPDGAMTARWLGPAWERLLGAPVPDPAWALDAWVAAVHPDDVPRFLARIADLSAGRPVRATYRLQGLDGVTRWVSDRAKPRPLAGGGVTVDGIVIDTTDEHALRAGFEEAKARYEAVLAGVDDLVYTLQLLDDGELHVVVESPAAARVGGAGGHAGVLALWGDQVDEADRASRDRLRAAVEQGRPAEAELLVHGLDGRERWVWHRVRPRTDRVGRRLVDGVASDVTARRHADAEMEALRGRLDSVVASIEEVLLSVRLHPDGRLERDFGGVGLDRLLGGELPPSADPVRIWEASIHADDRADFAGALATLRRGDPVDREYRVVGLDGRTRWIAWRARPRAGAEGRVVADGILADVTRQREATEAIAAERDAATAAARVDQLTGIANRRRLREVLGSALAASPDGVALLLLDVDRFKSVNDTYGHHVGDQVLREVAQRLGGAVRGHDTVGRWGGEEFCVVLARIHDDDVLRRIGDGLRRTLDATPFRTDAGPLPISASFGAARPAAGDDVDALVDAADRALYAAKRGGRNRVVLVGELDADGDAPPLAAGGGDVRPRADAA